MPLLEKKKEFLTNIVKEIYQAKKQQIENLKLPLSDINRPDFVWHYLLQSFATMGRSTGWDGLIGNKENYNKVTFDALERLTPEERMNVVEQTCRDAKVRMPRIKAEYIVSCFNLVKQLNGLEAVKQELLSQPGRDCKIKYLQKFHGIGPKYARNMMMDIYHEDFQNSIAIDVRIKAISSTLGLTFKKYADHENFYLDVAHKAGINGWELDRLMYNHRKLFEEAITVGMKNI